MSFLTDEYGRECITGVSREVNQANGANLLRNQAVESKHFKGIL